MELGEMTAEEALTHVGVRGMHWGVRKGSDTTGVSRTRGALLDSNQRDSAILTRGLTGTRTNREKRIVKVAQVLMLGKKRQEKMFNKNAPINLNKMREQNARLTSGKLKLKDRRDIFMKTSAADLMVSRTDVRK